VDDRTYDVVLSDAWKCNVHRIIFATGYVEAIHNTTFPDRSTILDSLVKADGFPALDPEF